MAALASNVLGTEEESEEVPTLESHKTSNGEIIGRLEVPNDSSAVMKGGEAAAAKDYANYFCSYAYLYHQKQMLTDQHRMQSYHTAVIENRSLFEGKVVVDVGTGSGVLSVWSGQAGAAKVWAVEFTDMAKHAMQLVKHNGLADVVTVVKGAVEELDLPPQSVDIMISEWMGYFLLRESMLDSLIRARDRFLKPGGVMMPSSATMMWGAISCEDMRLQKEQEMVDTMEDWKSFTNETAKHYGVDFGCLTGAYKKEQRDYFGLSSQWCELAGDQVVGVPVPVKHLELHTCTVDDALGVDETPFSFTVERHEVISAFAGWFDATFAGSTANPAPNPVTLSTHPAIGYTHWGQQVFFLGDKIDLYPGDELTGSIAMFRTKDSARLYHVTIAYTVKRSNPEDIFTPVKATWEMP